MSIRDYGERSFKYKLRKWFLRAFLIDRGIGGGRFCIKCDIVWNENF